VPKNYENWLAVDKVIAEKTGLLFWPTLYTSVECGWKTLDAELYQATNQTATCD